VWKEVGGEDRRQGNQCQSEIRCNHQIGDLDDKACALLPFVFLGAFAVRSLIGPKISDARWAGSSGQFLPVGSGLHKSGSATELTISLGRHSRKRSKGD
jgi:hypothetical protein